RAPIGGIRGRAVGAGAVLAAAWVVWVAVGVLLPRTTVPVADQQDLTDAPIRVRYESLFGPVTSTEHAIRFRGRFEVDRLTVECQTPAGWVRREFHALARSVFLSPVDTATVLIDNR